MLRHLQVEAGPTNVTLFEVRQIPLFPGDEPYSEKGDDDDDVGD
jgi:hypothetical protein